MPKKQNNGLHISTPYTKVPDGLWVSKEFNALKPTARCLYMVMLSRWNPYSPEEAFSFPYDEVSAITSMGPNTISKGTKELLLNGYIKIPQRGRYPNNVSLYKIDLAPLQKRYPTIERGRGTWPDYIQRLKEGIE